MKEKEFDIYFRKLYLPLGMFALRIVEDADLAEELVANTFANVWKKIYDGHEIENFKVYLYRAVRNECLSYLRNKKVTVSLDNVQEVDEETIDTSERDAKIWKAIGELPPKCREIFLLSKRDGLSNEQIAKEMGISIKTVKNQISKAFSRLREAISSGHKPFFLPFL